MLPWQMKSTLIIVLFLLLLPRNALFCKGLWGYGKMLWNYRLWQNRAELSMLLLLVSSKISSKRKMFTTKGFYFIFQDAPLLLLTLSIIPFSDKLFNTFKTVCSEQDNNSESCFLVTVESFLIASRIISSLPPISQLHIGHLFFLSEAPW